MKSVITCDMEGRVLTMNDDAVKIFGYKKEEIIGKKRVSIFSPGEVVSSAKVNQNFQHLDNQTKFFRNFYHPEPLTEYHEQEVIFTAANDEGKLVVSGVFRLLNLADRVVE